MSHHLLSQAATPDMDADDLRVVAEGNVTGPPDLEEVMFKITEAAERKVHLLLTPGELRVLVLHLSGG